MWRIFKGQTALRITLTTFIDLEGIENAVIRYRKPSGANGEFAAAVGDPVKGIIFHECIEGDIDVYGWWRFGLLLLFLTAELRRGRQRKSISGKRGLDNGKKENT